VCCFTAVVLFQARDAVHAVACSLEDVYNGVDKTMELERVDSPRATRKPHSKIVHVQKGMDNNARIVFRGDGNFIPGQCEPGTPPPSPTPPHTYAYSYTITHIHPCIYTHTHTQTVAYGWRC
jgi:hypothetical protein